MPSVPVRLVVPGVPASGPPEVAPPEDVPPLVEGVPGACGSVVEPDELQETMAPKARRSAGRGGGIDGSRALFSAWRRLVQKYFRMNAGAPTGEHGYAETGAPLRGGVPPV